MFTKLKKQVNEKSSVTDVNVDSLLLASQSKPLATNASAELNIKNGGLHLSRSKSGSDGNQSGSDDNSSTKSSSNASKTPVESIKSTDTSTSTGRQHFDTADKSTPLRQETTTTGVRENNSSVNNETDSIKSQLQQLNESLLKQIDLLTNELNEKLKENEDLRSKSIKLNNQIEDYEIEQERCRGELENVKLLLNDYENEIKTLKNDKDELIVKNAELSEKYELLKLVNNKQIPLNHSQLVTEHHHQQQQQHESSHLDETKQLRDELNERNKVIKNLQQRINDMKKTLQKELKYQALPNESEKQQHQQQQHQQTQSLALKSSNELNNRTKLPNGIVVDTSTSTMMQQKKNSVSFQSSSNMSRTKSGSLSSNSGEDVNSKYLKHVILKFLTSREYEAIHLVKAISVLLNFTSDEEKVLKESLEWKMSWFGTKPKLVT